MKERPILFSAPMVRALLAGRKTQTRRVTKGIPWRPGSNPDFSQAQSFVNGSNWRIAGSEEMTTGFRCPYGTAGDRLYVRETWARDDEDGMVMYRASQDNLDTQDWEHEVHVGAARWRPSIHMPRWASRILLEVTDVRVERLQTIREDDAIAEGLFRTEVGSGYRDRWSASPVTWASVIESQAEAYEDPRVAYRSLWNSINGAGAWDANPWVWIVSFKRIDV